MFTIKKAGEVDYLVLTDLAAQTFRESHGHSAAANDIAHYVKSRLNAAVLKASLTDNRNNYYIFYKDGQPAGFSNIIFNVAAPVDMPVENTAKLERIYLLQSHYHLGLGQQLLDFNIALAKQYHQSGIWLNVWVENLRALRFYKRNGFVVIGSLDFYISDSHVNPNHVMLLAFDSVDSSSFSQPKPMNEG